MENESQEKKKSSSRVFLGGLLLGILFSILAVCVIVIGRYAFISIKNHSTQTSASGSESVINTDTFQKMKTIEDVIDEYYYGEEITTSDIQDGIYKGMLEALNDPYSEYYTKEELEDALNSSKGISYGIGAYVTLNQEMDMAMIAGVMEGTPAEEAGLREGDVIYKVDGEETRGLSVSKVVALVKGKENTTVHLTIYRENEPDFLEKDIVRSKLIETETVYSVIL